METPLKNKHKMENKINKEGVRKKMQILECLKPIFPVIMPMLSDTMVEMGFK